MEAVAAIGVLTGVSFILTLSALAKSTRLQVFRGTLDELGVPTELTFGVAWLVVGAEWLCALLLIAMAGSWIVAGLVIALFGVFAVSGGYALAAGQRIACSCFGTVTSHRLGWPQVIQFPLVVGLLCFAAPRAPSALSAEMKAWWIVVVNAAVSLVFLHRVLAPWLLVRDQRTSFAQVRAYEVVDQP